MTLFGPLLGQKWVTFWVHFWAQNGPNSIIYTVILASRAGPKSGQKWSKNRARPVKKGVQKWTPFLSPFYMESPSNRPIFGPIFDQKWVKKGPQNRSKRPFLAIFGIFLANFWSTFWPKSGTKNAPEQCKIGVFSTSVFGGVPRKMGQNPGFWSAKMTVFWPFFDPFFEPKSFEFPFRGPFFGVQKWPKKVHFGHFGKSGVRPSRICQNRQKWPKNGHFERLSSRGPFWTVPF